ncbi:MAG TPA: 2,3-diaminopropionate biosynthesis protein SbnA [Ktedonobacteraceae bacterium]|nr:2,3-diaminopropionate biosynthesis protein SbnA [Ktedonobacteraceae bacterium]
MNISEIATLPLSEMRRLAQMAGNTPVERVSLLINGVKRTIHLKLEGANPTGSAKDRTAKGLMQALEAQGGIDQKSVIVESTSGNLGVALSFLCRAREYQFVAVVDPKTTRENIEKMRALGAEINRVEEPDPNGGYLLSRLERVRTLCQSIPRAVWPNQYENLANPAIHYTETGPEIYRQMNGEVDALFIAVSTGGTLAGISRFFREVSAKTRIIGVDAHGSVVFGTPPGPRLLTGIGSSRRSSFLSRADYEEYMLINDGEAFAFCRALSRAANIHVGGSSGAVLAACAHYLQVHPEAEHVVCLCADGGTNYNSSIYDDRWILRHGFPLSAGMPEFVQIVEYASARFW